MWFCGVILLLSQNILTTFGELKKQVLGIITVISTAFYQKPLCKLKKFIFGTISKGNYQLLFDKRVAAFKAIAIRVIGIQSCSIFHVY